MQKKKYACWLACWKQNGRNVRRSTGIKILPGAAGKKAKLLAEQTAKTMEQAATGETPAFKACDAVRKTAELHGGGGKISTARDLII